MKKGIPQNYGRNIPSITPKPPIEPDKLQPMGDWLILRRDRLDQTEGGIIVPESAQRVGDGVVVAVGPGTYQNGVLVPSGLSVGDRVIIAPDASYYDLPRQPDLVVLHTHNIMAKVQADPSVLQ